MPLLCQASVLILLFSTVLGGIEYLYAPHIFKPSGLLSWNIVKLRSPVFIRPVFEQLFNKVFLQSTSYLLITRIALCFIAMATLPFMASYPAKLIFTVSIILLAISILFFNFRNRYGLDGSDQFNTISITALSLCLLLQPDDFYKYYLPFIAFQTTLSYFISGIAKLYSIRWQNGTALTDIFNGQVYGNTLVAGYFTKFPEVARFTGVMVTFWETLFVFAFLAPESFMIATLALGVVFHLFNAVFMGLNCFFFSFISGYPAILFIYHWMWG